MQILVVSGKALPISCRDTGNCKPVD